MSRGSSIARGLLMAITKEHDRLWGQPAGAPKQSCFPKSETKFFAKVTDRQVAFLATRKNAGVTEMTLHQVGRDLIGKRVVDAITMTRESSANMADITTAMSLGLLRQSSCGEMDRSRSTGGTTTSSSRWLRQISFRERGGTFNAFSSRETRTAMSWVCD